jgi:hypothetical protein
MRAIKRFHFFLGACGVQLDRPRIPGAERSHGATATTDAPSLWREFLTTKPKIIMTHKINYLFQAGLTCLILGLTACGTTGTIPPTSSTPSATIEAALPFIRTGAAVATGAVLDFAVKQSGTRTRLANEMYAAANAVYALSGGTFPAPAQFESSILAFGGTQKDASYAQFSTAIAGLYAAYYPKLAAGDTKTATDLLNAIQAGSRTRRRLT